MNVALAAIGREEIARGIADNQAYALRVARFPVPNHPVGADVQRIQHLGEAEAPRAGQKVEDHISLSDGLLGGGNSV